MDDYRRRIARHAVGGRPSAVVLTTADAAARSGEEVLVALGSSWSGLSAVTAVERWHRDGPNALRAVRIHPLRILLNQFKSALMVLLIVTAVLAGALGDIGDAGVIGVILTASLLLGFVNELRAASATQALHDKVHHTTTVIRDGEPRDLDVTRLVVGDVVQLRLGQLVPADLRLLTTTDLTCDESVLTGESSPVGKSAEIVAAGTVLAERTDCAHMGTVVQSGGGLGVVVATGERTEFGSIAGGLSDSAPQTAFQRGLSRFSVLLLQVAIVLTMFIVIVNLVLGRSIIDSVLFALAIAVGITPQLLPAVVTTALAAGSRRLAADGVLVKRLVAIEDLGDIDILVTDKTGTLTDGRIALTASLAPDGTPDDAVLLDGLRATDSDLGEGGNELDTALCRDAGHLSEAARSYRRVATRPFDHERRMASAITVAPNGDAQLIVKGAPEAVLARCVAVGGDTTLTRLFAEGSRVVAVAAASISAERTSITDDDEKNLSLRGFLVFLDKPKASAPASLRRLAELAITVKVATGDNVLVADKVVAELGMHSGGAITGAELDDLDDDQFERVAKDYTVFARVTPSQKARIVASLRSHGQSVAFLGDGVNDAPALHAADVGISVDSATDVAKDSADVVMLHKDLGVLAGGVTEGRRTFANTIKYVQMSTSSNFGNMFSAAGASALLPFLPMLPSQILLNNLLYDSSQLAIPSDRVDAELLRSPSHWDIAGIRRFMLYFGPLSSLFDFLTFAVLIHLFHSGAREFHTAWFVESLCTQTLIVFVIRTRRLPFLRSRPGGWLTAAALMVIGIGAMLPFTVLAGMLGFVRLPWAFYGFLAGMVAAYLVLVELAKKVYYASPAFGPQLPGRWRDNVHRVERRAARFTTVGKTGAASARGD